MQLNPRRIDQYRLLNLKQFLAVFRTFENHINALIKSEDKGCNTSMLMQTVREIADGRAEGSAATASSNPSSSAPDDDECIICMERKSDLVLSCAHSFCCPCIEQWKVQNSHCPICEEAIDDDWVLSESPNADEINEQICAELFKLSTTDEEAPPVTTPQRSPGSTPTHSSQRT